MPVIRLQRLIIKSSLEDSLIKNLNKKQKSNKNQSKHIPFKQGYKTRLLI